MRPAISPMNDGSDLEDSKLRLLRVSEIKLSGMNELLYAPIDPLSEDIQELASSIQTNGLLTPLAVTSDHNLEDGHRRLAALKLVGWEWVEVRVRPYVASDPRFLIGLRECNRQRVKTFDEVIREQFLDASAMPDPETLISERVRASKVTIPKMPMQDRKARNKISQNKLPFLNAAIDVLNGLIDLWPISVRQVHYGLLNDPPLRHAKKPESKYVGDGSSYDDLDDLLVRARVEGYIPWEGVIDDPTRPITVWDSYDSVEPFINQEIKSFLNGFSRDYQISQPNHIEVLAEKSTVRGTLLPICEKYRIPLTISRGFSSKPPLRDLAERYRRSGKENLIVLILTDFDLAGLSIADNFATGLRDDFRVDNIHPIRVALNFEQIQKLQLLPGGQVKDKGPERESFVRQYGVDTYELEALPPKKLREYLEEAILSVLDIDLFNAEQEQETADLRALSAYRRKIFEGFEG
jgi:hypothetical protein